MAFDTTQEMSEVLNQWYLESFGVKIPIYQYTNEDFEYSTHWQQKSMNYSTKVLQPVLNELLINYPETKTSYHQIRFQLQIISLKSLVLLGVDIVMQSN